MSKELNKPLDLILEDFAKWTIKNVEHGIYVPLPSPETTYRIKDLLRDILATVRPEERDDNIEEEFNSSTRPVSTNLRQVGFNQALAEYDESVRKVLNEDR